MALFEGDSASSAFRKYRDAQSQGAFSLRGKFINATELTNQRLVQNTEVVNLMGALGLKLGVKVVLMDKDRALENLAKIHMLFNDTSTVNVNINQEVSAKEQLQQKLNDLDARFRTQQA